MCIYATYGSGLSAAKYRRGFRVKPASKPQARLYAPVGGSNFPATANRTTLLKKFFTLKTTEGGKTYRAFSRGKENKIYDGNRRLGPLFREMNRI